MRRGDETLDGPPIPLMTQGMCLTMEEFEEAYSTLEANITKFPCEDTGAHVELDYLGCENEFCWWYIEHEGELGGLPKNFSHHLLSTWLGDTQDSPSWGIGIKKRKKDQKKIKRDQKETKSINKIRPYSRARDLWTSWFPGPLVLWSGTLLLLQLLLLLYYTILY